MVDADHLIAVLSKMTERIGDELEAARTLATPGGARPDNETLGMAERDTLLELKALADTVRPEVDKLTAETLPLPANDVHAWIDAEGRCAPAPLPPPDATHIGRQETTGERLLREVHAMLAGQAERAAFAELCGEYEPLMTDPDALRGAIKALFEAEHRPPDFVQRLRALRAVVRRPQVLPVVRNDFEARLSTLPLPERYAQAQQRVKVLGAKLRYAQALHAALAMGDADAANRAAAQYHADMGTTHIHVEARRQIAEARADANGRAERAAKLDKLRKRRWARLQEAEPAAPVRLPFATVMPAH